MAAPQEELSPRLIEFARSSGMVAARWKASTARLDRGPYPDVARVPPGELKLLE